MERGWILGVVCFAFMIVGAVHTVWQIFKIVELDARSRGIKHPGLWGFLSANSNGASGLILYLIGRRNYPVISLSEKMKKEIDSRKRRVGAGLVFLAIGGAGLASLGILLG
ncbi:MAG TPA: hypothetical protein H9695_05075 [Candidatus Mediterraneibacter excrementigallinarum]|nr:hypothetical protein [Candidatus Mediterraneibacter excrementigallinarum]